MSDQIQNDHGVPRRPEHRTLEMWTTLQGALNALNMADFEQRREIQTWPEYEQQRESALTWLGDVRRALGELALALSETETSGQEGWTRLAKNIAQPPRTAAEARYIARQADDA